MPTLKKPPPDSEVSFALSQLLSTAGVAETAQQMNVSAVAGARRPAYHLLLPAACTETASDILTDLCARSFARDHSGWLIDVREARAIIEAAHRLSKARVTGRIY